MRNLSKQICFVILFSIGFSQREIYRNADDIKDEWTEYTSYQKEEMLSFCDFLFKEGHYERCLLSAFKILFKFPNDSFTPILEYYIARCYEKMNNYKLAKKYYKKVIQSSDNESLEYKAANYRSIYVDLLQGNIDAVLENTQTEDDPYLMTFRGYAYMKNLKWEEARTSFISAQGIFSHSHYDEMILPIYQIIENVNTIPRHNRYLVFITGALFPGGGQFMLGEKQKGQGILSSVGLMLLIGSWSKVDRLVGNSRVLDIESASIPLYNNYSSGNTIELDQKDQLPKNMSISSSSIKYVLPPLIIGAGVFYSSSWKSFMDTKDKNKILVEYYIHEKIEKAAPDRFLDFPEPNLVFQN